MRKIKIVSDGTAQGTRVLHPETGEDLTKMLGIRALVWEVDVRSGIAIATLECYADAELVGELLLEVVEKVDAGCL